jgi:lipopolysaccharide export system permease protein
MKIISKYIISNFVSAFVAALLVITFVMSIGVIFKVTDLLAKGVSSALPLLKLFIAGIPMAVAFAIPLASLISVLLLFGRLSSDGEIAAMKACGISIKEIVRGPLLVSLILTAVCLYFHNTVGPAAHYAQKEIIISLSTNSPAKLIEEGQFMDNFTEGITLYVGGKSKDGTLYDVRIFDNSKPGAEREIKAQRGSMRLAGNGEDILIELYEVIITAFDKGKPEEAKCARSDMIFEKAMKIKTLEPKEGDFSMPELIERIRNPAVFYPKLADNEDNKLAIMQMNLTVELHKRLSLSFSCFAFVLLGIPLGIKAHRKESSVGLALSLFLVFNFYLFVIVAEALVKHPQYRSDIIVWMPVIISTVLGVFLIRRSD